MAESPARDGDLLHDRYLLMHRIARGGMGTVWLAHDQRLVRDVAVKIIEPGVCGGTAGRVHLEAQALAKLNHPHIAAVHDAGVIDGDPPAPFLVMELVQGTPLAALAGRLPWPAAMEAIRQVADALAAAHARGIVHRDVTAANVLLTGHGAKLIDFGICALEDGGSGDDTDLMGTLAYVAPERVAGRPSGPAVDVFALGVLMHLMLTGELPSREPHTIDVPALPGEIAELCLRCLDELPERRPAAGEVRDTLLPFSPTGSSASRRSFAEAVTAPIRTLTRRRGARTLLTAMARSERMPRPGPVAASLLGTMTFAGLVWMLIAWTPEQSVRADAFVPAPVGACQVTYQAGPDGAATVTVAHDGAQTIVPGWRVSFAGADGARVSSPPRATALPTATPVQLSFPQTGTGMPTDFRLNDHPCTATVSTAPADTGNQPRLVGNQEQGTPGAGPAGGTAGDPAGGKGKGHRGKGKGK